jgi:D-alanyl-D-alanine carboxypeptidase
MSQKASARTRTHRTLRPNAVGLVVVTAAIIGTLAYQSASSSAPSFSEVRRGHHGAATTEADGAVTEADGALPDGVTVFDDQYPGVANLDPDLLQALREAATDAADDGIEFYLHSGWRSPEYQNQLLREAVSRYGSEEEAARWVATANTSAHVSGDAVDIASFDATA